MQRHIPVDSESIEFNDWKIGYTKSHILKSCCTNENKCIKADPGCCELCVFYFSLELPSLPDMVFHKNVLSLVHTTSGARIEFKAIDALKHVVNHTDIVKVACSDEWKESRPADCTTEKMKPFDWTFASDYQGTVQNVRVEATDKKIDLRKLMQREQILFYHDLTLFEDELHDHGISSCSVKIVSVMKKLCESLTQLIDFQRVMPSGFYILLRNFVRVDGVQIKLNDTRYYFETGNDYILKEFTAKSSPMVKLKHVRSSLVLFDKNLKSLLSGSPSSFHQPSGCF